MLRYFCLLILCLCLPVVVAQENTEQPIAIDAVNYHDRSIVVLFDDGHYVIYPLPEGVNLWVRDRIALQADGNILISYNFDDFSQRYEYILINAYTGEFQDIVLACGIEPLATPETAKWVYVEENELTYICNTGTDERIDLPSDVNWVILRYQDRIVESPDGEWLVLFALVKDSPDNPYDDYTVYSYEVDTGIIRYLGYIEGQQPATYAPSVENWVSDTLGAVSYNIDGEWSSNPFYVFDISKEDSLELAVNGWVYDFFEDPLHYEYLETTEFVKFKTGAEIDHLDCSLMIYDAQGLRNFHLGYACGSNGSYNFECTVLHPVEGGYIYLRFDSADTTESVITFVDYETGEKRDILSGEIEYIDRVEGDTIVYATDNNGLLDYPIGQGCPFGMSFTFEQIQSFSQETMNWR